MNIDYDLMIATEDYVDKQIAIMRKYEALSATFGSIERDQLIKKVSRIGQKLRNSRRLDERN